MEAVESGKTRLDEFIDAVVHSGKSADELLQEGGLLKELFKRVASALFPNLTRAIPRIRKHAWSRQWFPFAIMG